MLRPRDGVIVLVGDTPDLTGTERMLAAFRDSDELLIPIEADRSSNRRLLEADRLYLHGDGGTEAWERLERRPLGATEREMLDQLTPGRLGSATEVLRLGAAPLPVEGPTPGIELRELGEKRCWELLGAADVGRLAVINGSRPEIYPVNYALDGRTIVIRTAPGTKLAASIDRNVAFEVDVLSAARRTGWSVVVHGTAAEPRHIEDYLGAVDLDIQPWAAGEKSRFIVIEPTQVSGRVLPPAVSGVALTGSPTRPPAAQPVGA